MIYDADFFLNRFRHIPEDKWCTFMLDDGDGKHYVLGHCNVQAYVENEMSIALGKLFQFLFPDWRQVEFEYMGADIMDLIYSVNDGSSERFKAYGITPKERVINVLLAVKEKKETEAAVIAAHKIANTKSTIYETA